MYSRKNTLVPMEPSNFIVCASLFTCGSIPSLSKDGGTFGSTGIETCANDLFSPTDQILNHLAEKISGLSVGNDNTIVLFK